MVFLPENCIKLSYTMKITLFFPAIFLLGGVLLFPACKSSKNAGSADNTYTCPMHPEVTGKKGDHCPKCKMELVESAEPAVFCCAVHKECSGKMGAKCPKCGTPMEQPVEPYSCPMHPEQKGKKGDRCPKCNMYLEQKKPGKGMGKNP
jgi:hypothetical protein